MIEDVAAALERRDYRTAAQLLKILVRKTPQDPWVQLYGARLYEAQYQPEKAERLYRQLLKTSGNAKLLTQARQGLQRLEAEAEAQRAEAIAQATATPENAAQACLILEPLNPEQRAERAPQFARLMNLDAYTARLLLPTRSWRFYRSGPLGALQVYRGELAGVGIPSFCVELERVRRLPVYWGDRLQIGADQITARCRSQQDEVGHLSFAPQEVKAWLEGALPRFESVVDMDFQKRAIRKQQVNEYVKVVDLHLSDRGCILRLCEQHYQYHLEGERRPAQGLAEQFSTIPQRWQQLMGELAPLLPARIPAAIATGFIETLLDQPELLEKLYSQTQLLPPESKPWEAAFHLYSALHLLKP